ncbi:MAG: TolC family protein [Treponema sp.]|nr:TolC family protein [Candidatus Treponema equi]
MMHKNRVFAVIFAIIGLPALMFAQDNNDVTEQSVSITVDQAVAHALVYSSTLKTADIDLSMKERAGKYGWNVLLPTVNATATMARASDDALESKGVPASMMTESLHWTGLAGISASWNLSLAYIEQIRAAKASYEAGKITWEQSQRETKVNVQKLFYGLLLQQEALKLKKNTLENSRQRYVQADTNYRNGAVPEIRLLQLQVAYENLRPEVSKLEREFNNQIDTFAFLIGYPVGTKLELSGSINPEYVDVDYDKLMELYSRNSLDLRSLDKNIDVLKMNLMAINLASYTPALALNYTYQPMLTDFLDADKGGFPGGDWKDMNGSFSLTLAWNLTNLLPFSSNRQTAADLRANIDKLEVSRDMLLENQKINVRKAVDTLNDAKAQIDVMARNITLAQRSYDMTARSYRNGTTELLDLRDAEDQLNQAQLGLASQKFNYISALLDLETALNTSLKPENKLESEKTETANAVKGE